VTARKSRGKARSPKHKKSRKSAPKLTRGQLLRRLPEQPEEPWAAELKTRLPEDPGEPSSTELKRRLPEDPGEPSSAGLKKRLPVDPEEASSEELKKRLYSALHDHPDGSRKP
jgi:hypothetical protein